MRGAGAGVVNGDLRAAFGVRVGVGRVVHHGDRERDDRVAVFAGEAARSDTRVVVCHGPAVSHGEGRDGEEEDGDSEVHFFVFCFLFFCFLVETVVSLWE